MTTCTAESLHLKIEQWEQQLMLHNPDTDLYWGLVRKIEAARAQLEHMRR